MSCYISKNKPMKSFFRMNRILIQLLFTSAILVFVSACQEEERELIIPEENNAIPRESDLGKLIEQVTLHDGSFDDIIDETHCFSINLPYSIFLNGEIREIGSINDYELIDGTEDIVINFPVTINLANHKQVFITSIEQFEELKLTCMPEDSDIECIDFKYPLTLLLFNSTTNEIHSRVVNHDAEWYLFIDDLSEEVLMSIKYPVILETFSGRLIEVTHNTMLFNEILEWARSCNEMD